jgi:hypothetical protein
VRAETPGGTAEAPSAFDAPGAPASRGPGAPGGAAEALGTAAAFADASSRGPAGAPAFVAQPPPNAKHAASTGAPRRYATALSKACETRAVATRARRLVAPPPLARRPRLGSIR